MAELKQQRNSNLSSIRDEGLVSAKAGWGAGAVDAMVRRSSDTGAPLSRQQQPSIMDASPEQTAGVVVGAKSAAAGHTGSAHAESTTPHSSIHRSSSNGRQKHQNVILKKKRRLASQGMSGATPLDAEQQSSNAMAEAFASSLASIAAEGQLKRAAARNHQNAALATTASRALSRVERDEEMDSSSSTSSSSGAGDSGGGPSRSSSDMNSSGSRSAGLNGTTHHGHGGTMVTASATTSTSSGDDLGGDTSARAGGSRSSSVGCNSTNSRNNHASSNMGTSSSGDDGQDFSNNASTFTSAAPHGVGISSTPVLDQQQQHHHFHHHGYHHYEGTQHSSQPLSSFPHDAFRRRPNTEVLIGGRNAVEHQASSDPYGVRLPSMDDPSARSNAAALASVVAHWPPTAAAADATDSSAGSSADGEVGGIRTRSLPHPYREQGFHAIRKTFDSAARRAKGSKGGSKNNKSSETESSAEQQSGARKKSSRKPKKRSLSSALQSSPLAKKPRKRRPASTDSDMEDSGANDDVGGSSGSGTDGGYAGSASSNENVARAGSCSSPSVSSSEESLSKEKLPKIKSTVSGDPRRPMLRKKQESLSMSSEIADFSSGTSEESDVGSYTLNAAFASESASSTSSSGGDASSDEQEELFSEETQKIHAAGGRNRSTRTWAPVHFSSKNCKNLVSRRKRNGGCPSSSIDDQDAKLKARPALPKADSNGKMGALLDGKPPIMALGCDVMAHVLTFLEPPDIMEVLTMPLSKDWVMTFTRQSELWRVLCLLEPFKAQVEGDDGDSSDESDSYPFSTTAEMKAAFGKFRLLYASFVRCMRYLARIKDDAVNGRSPSTLEYVAAPEISTDNIGANQNLQQFFARARGVVSGNRPGLDPSRHSSASDISDNDDSSNNPVARQVANAEPIGVSDDGNSSAASPKRKKKDACYDSSSSTAGKRKKVRLGPSMLTQRLLGPAASGQPGEVELPWSCAIYSIVNWMVTFADVEGIQTMCFKVLPFLLENEQQRITAQRAGLTDIILRGMVMFPESAQLHTAAFHTIVLLARPLGGREGMLFHTSMVYSSGIFSISQESSTDGKNGIAVMLDSMRRFQSDEVLQAKSCWSLVNIALAPAQKEVLVKLGGIEVTANAMVSHPYSAEVQFRALFALINLVIPSVAPADATGRPHQGDAAQQLAADDESSESELLSENVGRIVRLVVLSMKNFCSSEAILNRACLVLHNLSLAQEYHSALLLTPGCFQMLEWCLANYLSDQVLQQSAAGTLHRLQLTLSTNETLRTHFAASLQAQQQSSLEQAHREAVLLHLQKERVQQQQQLLQEPRSDLDS